MTNNFKVEIIHSNEWQRLRAIRLKSLTVNPEAFGGTYEIERFNFLDAQDRDWKIQGLGVWIDNYSAIAAYEKLGFVKMGEDTPSTRQPGKFYQRMIRKSKN